MKSAVFLLLISSQLASANDLIPGNPGLENGVPHSPPRNQQSAQICWSYTMTGLAENTYVRNHPGKSVQTSAEYVGFYHYYHQFKTHLGYFRKLLNQAKKKDSIAHAVKLMSASTAEANSTDPEFVPDPGNSENIALNEVALSGMVPIHLYSARITEEAQENALEKALIDFAQTYMMNPANLDAYQGSDADGINSRLFNDLGNFLKPILKKIPLRPQDRFQFSDQKQIKTYTPISFMKEFLGFDPNSYEAFVASPASHFSALKAITIAMKQGYAVPIGFDIFDDQQNETSVMDKAVQSGVFTEAYCPNRNCKSHSESHEVLAVNWLQTKGNEVSGLVVKNSWGLHAGLSVTGEKNSDRYRLGYFLISAEFLRQTLKKDVNDSWDYVLPKKVAAQFPELKIER